MSDLNTRNSREDLEEKVQDIINETSPLRELTYAYTHLEDPSKDFPYGKKFNQSIFVDYLGLDLSLKSASGVHNMIQDTGDKQAFFESIKMQAENKLEKDITILDEYRNSDECPVSKKSQIELLINALKLTQLAVVFELELAGYESGLSDIETTQRTQDIHKLDEKLFGEHVSTHPEFILDGIAYLNYYLEKYRDWLNSEQIKSLENGVSTMLEHVGKLKNTTYTLSQLPRFIPDEKDDNFEKLQDTLISRDDYMKIFDMFFEVSGVSQRSELGDYSSFYDGDDVYGIPSDDGYAKKRLGDILKIAPHETSHYINLEVTQKAKTGKESGDMMKEEGLSMLTEALITGKDINTMNYMTFAGPSVVLNRLLGGSEYLNFQEAYLSLMSHAGLTDKGNVVDKTLRKKRAVSKKSPGGSNKDAMYALGLKNVLDYVRKNGDISHLFGGKISMESVKEGKQKPEDFGNRYISHIIFAEVIMWYIKKGRGGKTNDSKTSESDLEFKKYLKDKYGGLSEHFELFDETEKYTISVRKKVLEILQIVKNSSQTQ